MSDRHGHRHSTAQVGIAAVGVSAALVAAVWLWKRSKAAGVSSRDVDSMPPTPSPPPIVAGAPARSGAVSDSEDQLKGSDHVTTSKVQDGVDGGQAPATVGPYCATQRLLILGDGDFTFSSALVDELRAATPASQWPVVAERILATSYDTLEELHSRYPEVVGGTLARLHAAGVPTRHGVDATALHRTFGDPAEPGAPRWDRIVFNFPHHSGKGMIQVNRGLLAGSLASAYHFVRPASEGGEVHIALAPGQGGTPVDEPREFGNHWHMIQAAAGASLRLARVIPYDFRPFPGYCVTGRRGEQSTFRSTNALLHILVRDEAGVARLRRWRSSVRAAEAASVGAAGGGGGGGAKSRLGPGAGAGVGAGVGAASTGALASLSVAHTPAGDYWATRAFRDAIRHGVPPFVRQQLRQSPSLWRNERHPTGRVLRALRTALGGASGCLRVLGERRSVGAAGAGVPVEIAPQALASSGCLPVDAITTACADLYQVGYSSERGGLARRVLRPWLTPQLRAAAHPASRTPGTAGAGAGAAAGAGGGADGRTATLLAGPVCRREHFITPWSTPVSHEAEAVVLCPGGTGATAADAEGTAGVVGTACVSSGMRDTLDGFVESLFGVYAPGLRWVAAAEAEAAFRATAPPKEEVTARQKARAAKRAGKGKNGLKDKAAREQAAAAAAQRAEEQPDPWAHPAANSYRHCIMEGEALSGEPGADSVFAGSDLGGHLPVWVHTPSAVALVCEVPAHGGGLATTVRLLVAAPIVAERWDSVGTTGASPGSEAGVQTPAAGDTAAAAASDPACCGWWVRVHADAMAAASHRGIPDVRTLWSTHPELAAQLGHAAVPGGGGVAPRSARAPASAGGEAASASAGVVDWEVEGLRLPSLWAPAWTARMGVWALAGWDHRVVMAAVREVMGLLAVEMRRVDVLVDVSNGWKNHGYDVILRSDGWLLDSATARLFSDDLRECIAVGAGGEFR